jgi:OFA family oxalate/formate antiporter-like MFS transporter
MLCFLVVGMLIGGKLQTKIGASKVVLIGGLMLSAGMFATSIIPADYSFLIYVTYGIIGGFGVGASYNATISSAQKWFPQKRGITIGISGCAFWASALFFTPLLEMLLEQYGLHYTLLLLSGALLVGVLALFYFIRLPDEGSRASPSLAALLIKRQYTTGEALKTKGFYLLIFSLMLASTAFFYFNLAFMSIAFVLGTLIAPLVSGITGRAKTAIALILATAISVLLLGLTPAFLFPAALALMAFCIGAIFGIYPLLCVDYFGIKNVTSNYGVLMLGFAISAFCFPMLISLIYTGMYRFIALSASAALGAILVLVMARLKERD